MVTSNTILGKEEDVFMAFDEAVSINDEEEFISDAIHCDAHNGRSDRKGACCH
jgi:hypothetical protein